MGHYKNLQIEQEHTEDCEWCDQTAEDCRCHHRCDVCFQERKPVDYEKSDTILIWSCIGCGDTSIQPVEYQ